MNTKPIFDYVFHKLLKTSTDITSEYEYEPKNSNEIKVKVGDVLQVYDHRYDGTCYGDIGLFPIRCVTPQFETLHIIECKSTKSTKVKLSKTNILSYVSKHFPDTLQFHTLDLNQLDFHSVFKDLKDIEGESQCFIDGSEEFVDYLQKELAVFGGQGFETVEKELVL
ncbi:hypothetical protein BC833DRAFT_196726 [Globomyces pollinis-pini]|nr:hypothetical protein BC833DRAFT_196726 [Globomyces pollinis-pini]